jgi:phosphoribosylformylglycinamidine cyclo-ligase
MYQVFNMGHRLEMYVPETVAQQLIQVAATFNLDAKIIGRVEHAATKMVTLHHHQQVFQYQ